MEYNDLHKIAHLCLHAKLILNYAQGIRINLTRVDQGKTMRLNNELSSLISLGDNAYTHHRKMNNVERTICSPPKESCPYASLLNSHHVMRLVLNIVT